ncbi:type II toxin-antitoxin system Phd/YefM family antitoxin [Microcystis aeruginosa]|jgi:antitoxin YefM|uniref:Antitoxin n=1 Tax=Microcystis aeruginosa 11-30S32 TaxID=2358142 RepID=A0A510PC92_MICAE|nr:type II toxin-antitoxin system Phd/YefM family antitoxin [Microcystis aeruginosa]GCA91368.1 prevent-host-death protein [Microcystis aeruginosa 11-30S32]
MTKYLNITETGQKLVEWSEQMTDEPIIITKEGQPIMVALNYAQIESWLETLDILQDKEFAEILSEAIQQDQSEQRITWEDAKKQLGW